MAMNAMEQKPFLMMNILTVVSYSSTFIDSELTVRGELCGGENNLDIFQYFINM